MTSERPERRLFATALMLLLTALILRWTVALLLPLVPYFAALAAIVLVVSSLLTLRRWRRERW